MENNFKCQDEWIRHGYEVLHSTKAKRENIEWNISSINANGRLRNIENLYLKPTKEKIPINKHYEMKNTVNRIISDIEKNYNPKNKIRAKSDTILTEKAPNERKKTLRTFKQYSKYAEHLMKLCAENCENKKTQSELKPFQRLPNSTIPVASSKIVRRKVPSSSRSHIIIEKNVHVDEFGDNDVIRHVVRPTPRREIIQVVHQVEPPCVEDSPPVVKIEEKPKKMFADTSTQIFVTVDRRNSATGTEFIETENKLVSTTPQLTISKNQTLVEILPFRCDVAIGDDESFHSSESPGLLVVSESVGQMIQDPDDALEKESCLSTSSETVEAMKSEGEISCGEIYEEKFKKWFFGEKYDDDVSSCKNGSAESLDTFVLNYDSDVSF